MDEDLFGLTLEELQICAKMGIHPSDYAKAKAEKPAELSADALAIGAEEVAMALGISKEDWQKYGRVVFTEDTDE